MWHVSHLFCVSKPWLLGHLFPWPECEQKSCIICNFFPSPCFCTTCYFSNFAHFYPEDGGSICLQTVGICLPHCMMPWPWTPQCECAWNFSEVYWHSLEVSGKLCPICMIRALKRAHLRYSHVKWWVRLFILRTKVMLIVLSVGELL